MSILALLGAAIAIIILIILVRAGLTLASNFGYASAPLATVVWAAAFILCLLLVAWALRIPVPFFTW